MLIKVLKKLTKIVNKLKYSKYGVKCALFMGIIGVIYEFYVYI